MKKKLFLIILTIVAFACLLSVSVFAEDEEVVQNEVITTTSDEYGTVIRLNFDPGLDNAKQYVSTLNKIVDAGEDDDALCILTDGTYYYVFPSSYIVNEISNGKFEIYAEALAAAMQEFNAAMKTDSDYYDDYVITNTWGNRRLDNIVRFEFTTDVTWVDRDHCCMRKYPSLKEVRIGHAINFARARSMFSGCEVLEAVIGFENVTNVESDTSQFQGCKKLASVNLPTNITAIPDSMFFGTGTSSSTGFSISNLSECTQLTTIGNDAFRDSHKTTIVIPDSVTTIGARAFQAACSKGGNITIGKNSNLETIGENAFNSCSRVTTFYIPSSVESIGAGAFQSCSGLVTLENFENCKITVLEENTFYHVGKLRAIKIPATVTTIENAFVGNTALKTVYIPKTVESIADTFIDGTTSWGYYKPSDLVCIYTGSDASALSDCSILTSANVIQAKDYVSTNTYSGINLVVGYSHCEAYGHSYSGTGDCKDGLVCTLCTQSLGGMAEHTYYETLVYVTFDANGVYNYGCSNEGCTKYDIVDAAAAPIFKAKGYSTNPRKTSINGGYVVDLEALEKYVDLNGDLKYGIVIANAASFTGEFFDEENNITSKKAIMVEIDTEYSNFDCTIDYGAKTGVELSLIITAYVIDEQGNVTFVQSDSTNAGEVKIGSRTFKTVTLQSVVANVPAETKEKE